MSEGPHLEARTGSVDRISLPKQDTHMFRAISGALSLFLTILVLRLALPEVADVLIGIILKSLLLVSNGIDLVSSQSLH